jgi:uncharacterized protein YdeI (YjbR/CyaY-like superfamily)
LHPAGLARIAAAKRDGSWAKLDAVEDLRPPAELEKIFATNTARRDRFEAGGRSARKTALYWINAVKNPVRRAERIATVVSLLEQNVPATGPSLAAARAAARRLTRSDV